ncbi:MAG: lactate utilization protein C [Helicobacter sp.]|nr:lactate utilization protein C [Helicobacter sp.]
MSKQSILASIRKNLDSNAHFNSHLGAEYRDVINIDNENLLENYIALQKSNMAEVVISDPANLAKDVVSVLKKQGAKELLCALDLPFNINDLPQDEIKIIPYDKDVEEMRGSLFSIDSAIVKARCGVANLGTMGFVSSPKSPRLASLITPFCIMLLDKTKIYRNMFEALKFLKDTDGALPTNIFFIAGPSRTADIELKTVFGVHGPKATVTILY